MNAVRTELRLQNSFDTSQHCDSNAYLQDTYDYLLFMRKIDYITLVFVTAETFRHAPSVIPKRSEGNCCRRSLLNSVYLKHRIKDSNYLSYISSVNIVSVYPMPFCLICSISIELCHLGDFHVTITEGGRFGNSWINIRDEIICFLWRSAIIGLQLIFLWKLDFGDETLFFSVCWNFFFISHKIPILLSCDQNICSSYHLYK